MDEEIRLGFLKDSHADLARRWTIHSATIEKLWRSFDREQRANCLTVGNLKSLIPERPYRLENFSKIMKPRRDGRIPEMPSDPSKNILSYLNPEWNLRDIADSGPDHLLNMLRHRATKSLFEQYSEGVEGDYGDHDFIVKLFRVNGLSTSPQPFHKSLITFSDDENYGKHFQVTPEHDSVPLDTKPDVRAGLVVSEPAGELIIQRQTYLTQSLNLTIQNILRQSSTSHEVTEAVIQSKKLAHIALPEQYPRNSSSKRSLKDLALEALDQRTTWEEYMFLLSTEPTLLAWAVATEFITRPERMADERGRQLPVYSDKYINDAFLEAIFKASKAAAIWNYIIRLLKLLETFSKIKICRTLLLQELSNTCQLEYTRAQAVFKGHIQLGIGSKYFQRLSGSSGADGRPRTKMKKQPETLTRADPQLCYILHLCHIKTNASEAVQWLEKLGNLYQSHPLERKKLQGIEIEALYQLICIVEFIKGLYGAFSVPSFSRNTGQPFISQLQTLENKLNGLKDKADFSDFAFPIEQLAESDNAQKALRRLDQLAIEKFGLNIQSLHQHLIDESCEALEKSCQQVLNSTTQNKETASSSVTATLQSAEKPTVERKEKQKSRPLQSNTSEPEPQLDQPLTEEPSLPQRITVRSSTTKVFSNIFNKSQERGSVDWDDFVTAMADVGFSIVPKYGSVITFYPPDSMEVQRPLTLHRPHKSELEGYHILILSRRLKRAYAWDEDTFVEA